MNNVLIGLQAAAAFSLLVAGLLKLGSPESSVRLLQKLIKETPLEKLGLFWCNQLSVRAFAVLEIVLAVAWPLSAGGLSTSLTLMMAASFLLFAFITVAARLRGASCGCFGSFSRGSVGIGDIAVNVLLAAGLCIRGLGNADRAQFSVTSAITALATTCLIAAARLQLRRPEPDAGATQALASSPPEIPTPGSEAAPSRRGVLQGSIAALAGIFGLMSPAAFAGSADRMATRTLRRLGPQVARFSEILSPTASAPHVALAREDLDLRRFAAVCDQTAPEAKIDWMNPQVLRVTFPAGPESPQLDAVVLGYGSAALGVPNGAFWMLSAQVDGQTQTPAVGFGLFPSNDTSIIWKQETPEFRTIAALREEHPLVDEGMKRNAAYSAAANAPSCCSSCTSGAALFWGAAFVGTLGCCIGCEVCCTPCGDAATAASAARASECAFCCQLDGQEYRNANCCGCYAYTQGWCYGECSCGGCDAYVASSMCACDVGCG